MAPKIALLNSDGEIIVQRKYFTNDAYAKLIGSAGSIDTGTTDTLMSMDTNSSRSLMKTCDSTKTIRRNDRVPSFVEDDFKGIKITEQDQEDENEEPKPSKSDENIQPIKESDRSASEMVQDGVDEPSDGIVHEINVESYLMQTLDTLYKQDYICTVPTIVTDQGGNSLQVMFVCEKGVDVDMVMAHLGHIGVGSLVGNVDILPLESCKFYKRPVDTAKTEEAKRDAQSDSVDSEDEKEKEEKAAEAEKEKKLFMEAASQIRVEQIVEQIHSSATFSFDYLSLLLIASTISGIGLATNNTVAIVASMLVSPIMGPVMALTFGTVINDRSLTLLGLKSELVSLLLCVVVGFIIGIISIFIGTAGLWPTDEMKGRGLVDGLAIGFAIAIPSGIGVALSMLGNNTSSLVGVAISASLLPPAVNCGLAFAYAAMGFEFDPNAREDDDNFDYTTPSSFVDMGGISLALTVVNIGAIYVSGLLMFKIKEVAPIKNKTAFWQRDIKVSRRINTAIHKHQQQNYYRTPGNLDSAVIENIKLHPELRQELRQLRRANSVDLLSSSTVGSPDKPSERPNLMDVFRQLDDVDDGINMRNFSSSTVPPPDNAFRPRPVAPADSDGTGTLDRVRAKDPRRHTPTPPAAKELQDIKARFRAQGRAVSVKSLVKPSKL
eukprot:CAMPEP_0185032222 /NCGR_PEP_ID=MMETSP1103-20130426/20149_1 /TAXON_ID=36769 /ORGANISM="Paraphysomonas bandaiensis, Strain Caron Lab Isolate" /LENGTH=662 /DNA_ID=CAMNT_0027568037 /DNA_START=53 /DNA_END=2041 /DNA_ORIENTATION=+